MARQERLWITTKASCTGRHLGQGGIWGLSGTLGPKWAHLHSKVVNDKENYRKLPKNYKFQKIFPNGAKMCPSFHLNLAIVVKTFITRLWRMLLISKNSQIFDLKEDEII